MNEKKYTVVRFEVETKYGTAREVENTLCCEIVERDIVGEFNSLEEARACYENLKTETIKLGDCYINECKEIEVYFYDDDDGEYCFAYSDNWDYGEWEE